MSIEITLKFENVAEAVAALSLLGPTGEQKPKTVKEVLAQPAANGSGAAQQPASNGAGAIGGPVTIEQANAAFKAYLAKGQGRTAKVAMDTIFPQLGIRSLREATPEQLASAKAAFEEATK